MGKAGPLSQLEYRQMKEPSSLTGTQKKKVANKRELTMTTYNTTSSYLFTIGTSECKRPAGGRMIQCV